MKEISDRGTGYVLLLPSLSVLVGVALVPIVFLVALSLRQRVLPFGIDTFIGLGNYALLFQTPRFWNSLGVSAYFAVLSVLLEVTLGLAIALLLTRGFPRAGLARALILLPWAIPTVVTAKMWDWLYHPDLGLFNYLLQAVGLKPIYWLSSPSLALHAAIVADVWKMTPFVVILLMAGLAIIPQDVYRAAALDGAAPWQTFWHMTLPLLRPVLLVVILFRMIDALRAFDLLYVLTGGGPADRTETLSIFAYKIYFQTLQFGYGASIGVVMFLIVGLASLLQLWAGRADFRRLIRRAA